MENQFLLQKRKKRQFQIVNHQLKMADHPQNMKSGTAKRVCWLTGWPVLQSFVQKLICSCTPSKLFVNFVICLIFAPALTQSFVSWSWSNWSERYCLLRSHTWLSYMIYPTTILASVMLRWSVDVPLPFVIFVFCHPIFAGTVSVICFLDQLIIRILPEIWDLIQTWWYLKEEKQFVKKKTIIICTFHFHANSMLGTVREKWYFENITEEKLESFCSSLTATTYKQWYTGQHLYERTPAQNSFKQKKPILILQKSIAIKTSNPNLEIC